jgi:hypothetical protein
VSKANFIGRKNRSRAGQRSGDPVARRITFDLDVRATSVRKTANAISPKLLMRSLGRVMVGNQTPAPLLLYPHPGKPGVSGDGLAFVLPNHG